MTGVKSVKRAISLLSEMARGPRGLVELAEACTLPTTTAARLLATLEDLDAVRRDDDGRYYVGPTVGAMAAAERGEHRLPTVAQPYLDELVVVLDEAVGLSVVSGEDNVTIAQVDIPRPVQAQNWKGTRWALTDGPAGYAVVSTWPHAKVRAFVGRHRDIEDLAERIASVPESGVWWGESYYVDGLTSATVPVLGRDDVAIGTLYAYGPSYRFPAQGATSMIEDVLSDSGQRLSRAWQARTHPTEEAG